MRRAVLVLLFMMVFASASDAQEPEGREGREGRGGRGGGGRFRGGRGEGGGFREQMKDLPPECREKLRALREEFAKRREEIMAQCKGHEGHKDKDKDGAGAGGGEGGDGKDFGPGEPPASPAPAESPK